ncbi:MAG: PAS domain S-box protein, partial [Desulfosarcinaceae bacterium]
MKSRTLISILLPMIAVGILLMVFAGTFMARLLVSPAQKHIDASLVMITSLGYDKCAEGSRYIQSLGLEKDRLKVKSLQNEILVRIEALGKQFEDLDLMAVNQSGEALGDPVHGRVTPFDSLKGITADGTIFSHTVFDQPSRCVARYFPDWGWYLVGYIPQAAYDAPVSMAPRIIFAIVGVFLLAVIFTAGLGFHFYVNLPLKRIIDAAEKVADGQFEKVSNIGKGEIGQVTAAFNAMVDNLAADQEQINRIMSAMRQSEELYRLITENSGSQILLIQGGRIIFANRRTLTTLGYSSSELINRSALMHLHSDDHAKIRRMARLGSLGRPTGEPVECRFYTKNADMRWVELAMVRATFKNKPVLLVHGIDITQRKQAFEEQQRLESKLRQAQKMEAIGTLAGGIAHDFNNLLMGVQGNVSLLRLGLPNRPRLYERLRNIEKYIKNGSELTRQLLGYARGGKYQVKPIRINDLVNQSARMFGRTKKEIVIHYDLEPESWSVEADRGQIEQVLLNLYVNAWQAMPGGGHLHLKTRNRRLGPNELKTSPDKTGAFVQISVSDTGVGMDEQTLQRIYDPFFTTKQRERGTGLGLASAYGIIKNHDGAISCESRPGKGTTFHIYLPRTEKVPAEETSFDEKIQVGSETILLVDDEQMVLEVGRDLLEHLGYEVICADSGQKALDIFRRDPGAVDLVLLDMVMPEMGGKEIFQAMRKIRFDIPVLLCSGYSLSGPASD